MAPAERMLFTWWLATKRPLPLQMWFDVHMDGIPGDLAPASLADLTDDPAMLRMWWYQTAKRCDVILRWPLEYQVVELRHTTAPQTVGELHIYDNLSRAEWPDLPWRPPLLITERIDPKIHNLLLDSGYQIANPSPTAKPAGPVAQVR